MPPVTLEGWYICHQLFSIDHAIVRSWSEEERAQAGNEFKRVFYSLQSPAEGWSRLTLLAGSNEEVMIVHLRTTLEEISDAQRRIMSTRLADALRLSETYLGVTEAGMYALVAELSREATKRGGAPGDDDFNTALAARLESEKENAHVRRRLFPDPPDDEMPYVCFYPMSKRRAPEQNWYELPSEERSRLMWEHGKSGRRHAGKIRQIVSGGIGFNEWEWGVTLFGSDPLNFKKAVTEMRFDEVSARYAEFGRFFVGRDVTADECVYAIARK